NKLIKDLKIGIIGGGPSGLGLARYLQINGFDNVKVFERDTSRESRPQGSSLDLHEDIGQMLLKAAGLIEQFKSKSRPDGECFTFTDKNCNVKVRKPFLKIKSQRPEIDRGDLRDILIDSLQENTITWGCHFKQLKQLENGQIELEFNDGEIKEIVDFVIGCDGINSKVRSYITPIKPQYMGITMIEGEITNAKDTNPQLYQLVNQGLMFTMDKSGVDDGIVFLAQQKSDGSLIFSFAQLVEETWVKSKGFDIKTKQATQEIRDYLKNELVPNWSPMYHQLIDQSEGLFKLRILYQAPLDQNWESKSNITIIGDACHPISPFAGLGCNNALYDSYELGNFLIEKKNTDSTNLKTLISTFEQTMLSRWRPLARITMENEGIVFNGDLDLLIKKRFGLFYLTKNYLEKTINLINYITD
ncbi:hypothetical protein DICPUDRAFT_18415, partial [Dictyostelium purpureum]